MKTIFVVGLVISSLGGCASIDRMSSYESDLSLPASGYSSVELSSFKYLHSLNTENATSFKPPVGEGALASMSLPQNDFPNRDNAEEPSDAAQSDIDQSEPD